MLTTHFKTAWRNLVKNKVYSALNIVGLATGMAVALLIGLWVYDQYSYDRFMPGYENAYKALTLSNNNGEMITAGGTCYPLADALKKDIPGIQYTARTSWMSPHSLVAGDKKLYPIGAMADVDFLRIFQYPLLNGNAKDVLKDPYSIVLTESTAIALFGPGNPINKTVRIDNLHDLTVTGVLKDLPANSTFQFHFLVPFAYYIATHDWVKRDAANWRDNSFQTFVSLQPGVLYDQVAPLLQPLEQRYNPEDYKTAKSSVIMQPLKDWHLYSDFKNGRATGGFIEYVKMFSIIGLLVLFIACINYINLATARSEKRAREVGIRKAIGSPRHHLVIQFLVESILVSGIALALSILFVQLALPAFNQLTRNAIRIPYTSLVFWLIMISYTLFTGLVSGSRPAFYLSSFNPVKVLKGTIQTGKAAALPRKILVVLQFSCSIALIIGTTVVYQQIRYAKDRPTGYDADRLLMTDASNDLSQDYTALKHDLLQSGMVTDVTMSSSPVTAIWANQRIDDWQGKLPGETLGLSTIGVCDADYFSTLGIRIREGRNFTGNKTDSLNVILNEAAVRRMRYKTAINQVITWHDIPQRVRVVGVAKDALMASPFSPAEPTIFIYTPDWASIITYRLSPTVNTQAALVRISAIFSKYNPSYPFQYHFVDESYAAKFALETLIGKLSGLFAALAIFISCLGLFGLAAYMAEQRTKEIGVRKVLGASVSQVWLLLSRDFIGLVVISCLIASPLAFYFLHNWLQKYDYRIAIGPGVFLLSAMLAIVVTLVTISFQAIKAALANPVRSLRSE